MNARVYDPLLGRFMTADPVIADTYDSQSRNRYSYVDNRPLSATDPTGLWPRERVEVRGRRPRGDSGRGYMSAFAAVAIAARTQATGGAAVSPGPNAKAATEQPLGDDAASDSGEGPHDDTNYDDNSGDEAETTARTEGCRYADCVTAFGTRLDCAKAKAAAAAPGDPEPEWTERVEVRGRRIRQPDNAPLHVQFFVGLTVLPEFFWDMGELALQAADDPEKAARFWVLWS